MVRIIESWPDSEPLVSKTEVTHFIGITRDESVQPVCSIRLSRIWRKVVMPAGGKIEIGVDE